MKKLNLLLVLFLLTILQSLLCPTVYSQNNDKFKKSKQAIPNHYIVVLKDVGGAIVGFPNNQIEDEKVRKAVADLSLLYGGRVHKLYSRAIKGYAVEMSPQQASALSQDNRVKYDNTFAKLGGRNGRFSLMNTA